ERTRTSAPLIALRSASRSSTQLHTSRCSARSTSTSRVAWRARSTPASPTWSTRPPSTCESTASSASVPPSTTSRSVRLIVAGVVSSRRLFGREARDEGLDRGHGLEVGHDDLFGVDLDAEALLEELDEREDPERVEDLLLNEVRVVGELLGRSALHRL